MVVINAKKVDYTPDMTLGQLIDRFNEVSTDSNELVLNEMQSVIINGNMIKDATDETAINDDDNVLIFVVPTGG